MCYLYIFFVSNDYSNVLIYFIIDYIAAHEDTLLLGIQCPNFILEMEKVLNTSHARERISQHLPLFDYISNYTGMNIRRPSEVALLYSVLETKVRNT